MTAEWTEILVDVNCLIVNELAAGKVPSITQMDGVPTDRIAENAIQCIMAGELNKAAFGLIYLIHQKHFQQTNRADKKLEDILSQTKETT